jgi:hypothetical protein
MRNIAALIGLVALAGCSSVAGLMGAATTPGETDGQLFCSIAKSDGTSEIASVIDASEPGAVFVTGIASVVVASECALAAARVPSAVSGIPVPPAVPSAAVMIVPPLQTPASAT